MWLFSEVAQSTPKNPKKGKPPKNHKSKKNKILALPGHLLETLPSFPLRCAMNILAPG